MTQKVALVTGAAQGIGYAAAKALLEDGHTVVMADCNTEELTQAAARLGPSAVALPCDVGHEQEILDLFDAIEQQIGTVSVLVNNAGIAPGGDFLETSAEEFKAVLNVNLVGTFVATQRAARSMIAAQIQGAVINMSSINAQLAIPTIAAYCASKGGIMQLTKVAALALAPHGIRVNAIGPGSIDTAMMAGVNQDDAAMQRVLSRTPMGRVGAPDEIGQIVAFLASDKASYITGETIYADGGRLALNYTV